MTNGVEPKEVAALRDALLEGAERSEPAVEPRNFRQPRRLSRLRLTHLAKVIAAVLPRACNELASTLRGYHKVTLVSVSEANSQGLFHGLSAPFVVLCFDCRGQSSWLAWDIEPASAMVERVLAGPARERSGETAAEDGDAEASPTAAAAKRLSRSEKRVVTDVLLRLIRPVTEALGLSAAGEGRLAQEPEELTTHEDAGPDADARRLLLHFAFEGPGGPSDLRLYLPGVSEGDEVTRPAKRTTRLPEHLERVGLSVVAYLGSVDVPLSELLALEVGDVIPLGVEVGSPLCLYVEDRACARATWGRWHGSLAVKIQSLDARPGDIDHPTEES